MWLQLVSDLHLDFRLQADRWKQVVDAITDPLESQSIDVLVVAGDLAEARQGVWTEALTTLAQLYPTVLLVLGNHEHYATAKTRLERQIDHLPTNIIHLDASEVELGGLRFAGCTLWFPEGKPRQLEDQLNDFRIIPDFRSWVYQQHQRDVNFLKHSSADVIITHHAPHPLSVHPRYLGDSLNHFFFNNLEELILKINPKLWLHGHTHQSFDYKVGSSRVICHPLGYPGELYRSDCHYRPVLVELEAEG